MFTYSHTNRFIIRAAILLLAVCTIAPAETRAANDAYVPYIESLQAVQQRAAAAAAPRGFDQPLPVAQPVSVSAEVLLAPATEQSQLEVLADAKRGPLSLAQTQQDQVLSTELELFGYDIFTQVPTTFAPVEGIPVPSNYVIGPGDSLTVQLFGKRNVEYRLVVTREGDILVPEYGPVKVAGLGFDEVEALLTDGFKRRVIGARAVVTMGQLRTIQIRLAGDVVQPGIYTVGGLSTLIDALLTTGGVRETGSLRNIQLVRGGKKVAMLDLYDLLLRGQSGRDQFLEHNDTIFVPPIGKVVYIGGEVQRPAIYELRGEKSVGEVLAMAGGLLPTASLRDSHIERIQADGFRTLVDFATAASEDAVRRTGIANGDFLRVLPLEDQLQNVVLLDGLVERPGGYQFRAGMRVSDLLSDVEALLPGADVDVALVKREQKHTLRTEIVYVNLLEAMAEPGSAVDLLLQPRDEITVFNLSQSREAAVADVVRELNVQATDARPARVVQLNGAVRFSGVMPLQSEARLLDVLAFGGGPVSGADTHYGLIVRTLHPSSRVEVASFSLASARMDPTGAVNPIIEPGDRLYVFHEDKGRQSLIASELQQLREQAGFGAEEKLVTVLGEVRHGGVYPLEPGMRASDLLCAAGGLSRKANGVTAQLSRVTYELDSDNVMDHLSLDSARLLRICALKRSAPEDAVAQAEYLAAYEDAAVNPVLQATDTLGFSEKPGWVDQATVTLSGEVRLPGVYAVDRGETLCELLQRAGGLTADAYAFGGVFTRESVRAMQQETIDQLHESLDDLMVDLSLSHSFNNDGKSSPEWAGKQDYLRAIRDLERAEANGRLVVDLERHAACRGDALVLQDGDALAVPREPDYVQVAGQVYVPTSHLYSDDRKVADYVELSGGHTVLGRIKHTYVIQANGEVRNIKGGSSRIARKRVMPGARIYVPLNVDRMNTTERAQTWVQTLINSAILAGVIL